MFIILFLLWIIFNGNFTVEICIFGLIISAAVCFFMNRFAGYSFRKELKRVRLIPAALTYLGVLLVEIFKANFYMLKLLFKGQKRVRPAICTFRTSLRTDAARTILSNSITLTPGTITVALKDNELTVHCLDESLAEGIDASVFIRRLEKMEARL